MIRRKWIGKAFCGKVSKIFEITSFFVEGLFPKDVVLGRREEGGAKSF
jgi:hypothetical protein